MIKKSFLVAIALVIGALFATSSAAFAQTGNGKIMSSAVVAPPFKAVGIAEMPNGSGYWLALSNGGVVAYGAAQNYGSMAGKPLRAPIVGIATTSNGEGYWLVAADGGVFAFGNAPFYGSAANLKLAAPIVGISALKDSAGYWLVGADGGVFAFGAAAFDGREYLSPGVSAVGIALVTNNTIGTDLLSGYTIANANGSFADRDYKKGGGPATGMGLNAPIVGIASVLNTAYLNSFLMVDRDGEVFPFGSAQFCGSLDGSASAPVVGIATDDANGYLLAEANGEVVAFTCNTK